MTAVETVTVVEESTHMVRTVWAGPTITMTCWCGWARTITEPAGDYATVHAMYREARALADNHQHQPPPEPDELLALFYDWPVIVR